MAPKYLSGVEDALAPLFWHSDFDKYNEAFPDEERIFTTFVVPCWTDLEADRLINSESIEREALKNTEENGIVFIDEIDKVRGRVSPCTSRSRMHRDASLPVLVASFLNTKSKKTSRASVRCMVQHFLCGFYHRHW
jgi:hypothetical protein